MVTITYKSDFANRKERKMKKVVIFGAAGHTGKYITEKMKAEKDIALSVFVRKPEKFGNMDLTGVNVIQGDALNADEVEKQKPDFTRICHEFITKKGFFSGNLCYTMVLYGLKR